MDPQALQRKAGQRPVPVHRAGCQDTAREARRSDSTGAPEEHASKAEVVRALWAGIIAEDPDTYGTPGGMASLEAETVFLACIRGLPDE